MLQEPITDFELIPLSEASVLTENWQKENYLKAFLFHKNDIECLAQETDVVGVRFYVGITKKENEEDALDMIVVGVNSLNEDIIYTEDTNTTGDFTDVSGIYDFALPCPKLCDPESVLNHKTSNLISSYRTGTMKTVQHSTAEECAINLGAISEQDAVDIVTIWQCEMEETLISIYFNIESLDAIFREFKDANALRVYFGLEDREHRVILIGATNSEEAYFSDILSEEVYKNIKAPCTGNGESSCAVNRILYKECN